MFGLFGGQNGFGRKDVSNSVEYRSSTCISQEDWNTKVEQIRGECDYDLDFKLLNGKRFYVCGGVENSDASAVFWRDQFGLLRNTCRRGVSALEIIWKMRGQITHWNRTGHFGFLRGDDGTDYYYDERTVEDAPLLQEMNTGRTGQCVVFHILRKSIAGKPPLVAVKGRVPDKAHGVGGLVPAVVPDLLHPTEGDVVVGTFRDTEETASVQLGFVTRWFTGYHYGFLVNGRKSFYFHERDILDQSLRDSLSAGKIRQQVRYLPMPNRGNRATPPARIIEMLSEDTTNRLPLPAGDSDYDVGRRLMNDGKLSEAAVRFRKVLDNPDDVCRLSALRDLAETVNRGEPSEEAAMQAFNLIESHRREFPDVEQPCFERMEIIYLMKARRYGDAAEKITGYLKSGVIAESSQRRYYQSLLKTAMDKTLAGTESAGDSGPTMRDVVGVPAKGTEGFKDACSRLTISDLTAETFGRIEEVVDRYRHCFADAKQDLMHVLREMRVYAQQADYSLKELSYQTVKDYLNVFRQERLSQMLTEVWRSGPEVAAGLEDVLQRVQDKIEDDFRSFVEGPVGFTVAHAEGDAYELKDGKLWLNLRLQARGPRGLPLKNVAVTCWWGESEGEQLVIGSLACGGEKEFPFVFKPDPATMGALSGSLRFALSYEKCSILGVKACDCILEEPLPFSVCNAPRRLQNMYGQYLEGQATGEYFVGRTDTLDFLEQQFSRKDGSHMACIYGMHRSGKSSLLSQLKDRLNSDAYFYADVINAGRLVMAANPVETLCKPLIRQIKEELKRREIWTDEQFRQFDEVLATGYAADDWVGQAQEACRKLAEHGCSAVLRVDEFTDFYDKCCREPGYRETVRGFLNVLKEEFMKKKLLYVVLVGQDHMLKFRQAFPAQLVVNPMRLFCLAKDEVGQLVKVGLADEKGESLLSEDAFELVWSLTGGYPKYVQNLLWRITQYVKVVRRIEVDDVGKAAETFWSWKESANPLLTRMDPPFFEPFVIYEASEFDDAKLLTLNYRIADRSRDTGWVRLSDVIQCPEDRELLRQLRERRLIDTDSVEESPEEKIRIRVGLFAEYLRHNHNPDLTVGDFNSEKGAW